jgi:hypothetical protein
MWLIIYMTAVILYLIIWGFVAGRQEKQLDKKDDKTVLAD